MKSKLPIVFIDNSNTVSDKIHNLTINYPLFEYFTFISKTSFLGKGHGEKEILDFAFYHSQIVKNSEWIVKITGRYIIHNISTLIKGIENSKALVSINYGLNLTRSDTRIIFFKEKFYIQYFKPYLERYLNESKKVFFEQVLAQSVHALMAEGHVYLPWPLYPTYDGINGANGRIVKFNPYKNAKYQLYFELKKWIFKQII